MSLPTVSADQHQRVNTNEDAPTTLLWTKMQVAEALGLGARTLDRLLASGRFCRPIRIGRSVRWRPEDVRAWLDDQARQQQRRRS